MNARLTVIAFAAALLVASPARAQGDRWERQVHRQLERATASLGAKGVVRPLGSRVGELDTDESESFTVTLQAGVSYIVVGTCDEDCERLSLVLDGVLPGEGRDGELPHESLSLRRRADHSPSTLMITRFLRWPSHSP